MADGDSTTRYFKEPGESNTDAVLDLVARRADKLGIDTVVVASTRGITGIKAVEKLKGRKVIVVTHSSGFRKMDSIELTAENRVMIETGGGEILTCQHALGGEGRAVRKKFGTYMTEEIVAHVLRIFGEGMKVAVEIVKRLDRGANPYGANGTPAATESPALGRLLGANTSTYVIISTRCRANRQSIAFGA